MNQNRRIKVRRLASLVGQIISMSVVIGSVALLKTKCLSIDIVSAPTWNSMILISEESKKQISFWKSSLDMLNRRDMKIKPSSNLVVYTDASDTSYGGYCVRTGKTVSHGLWEESERIMSSTWRELAAVDRVLRSFVQFLKGENIKWFTDNANVVSIVQKGSMKNNLQDLAMNIFQICLEYKIGIEIEWIPRELNEQADYLSRIVDFDE